MGFLGNWSPGDLEGGKRFDTFRLTLEHLGWTPGKNLTIETRFGNNSSEGIQQAASELAAQTVEVIVTTTSTTTRALMDATRTVPIVAAVSGDPIALGFTANLAHPTGNVTGFSTFNDVLAAKRFETRSFLQCGRSR